MSAEASTVDVLKAAHTPGPWKVWSSIYVGMKAAVVSPGQDPLVTVAEVRTGMADANLLAAAPDLLAVAHMLAALESADNGRSFPTREACAAARAAIALAEGEV